ncbi:MAG: zinc-ribbon domain-containing protein [Actinomycetota bacterium]|nr:zinc-ribbon domain-containing protein [Actinomycetota bacterium]
MARWRCPTCGKKNDAGRTVCVWCSVPREGGKPYAPDQWICPEGTRNDADATVCACCGFEPPPRPEPVPDKSLFAGLFGRPATKRPEPRPQQPQPPETPSQPRPAAGPGRFCTACGAAVEPEDRFCASCGTPVRGR